MRKCLGGDQGARRMRPRRAEENKAVRLLKVECLLII